MGLTKLKVKDNWKKLLNINFILESTERFPTGHKADYSDLDSCLSDSKPCQSPSPSKQPWSDNKPCLSPSPSPGIQPWSDSRHMSMLTCLTSTSTEGRAGLCWVMINSYLIISEQCIVGTQDYLARDHPATRRDREGNLWGKLHTFHLLFFKVRNMCAMRNKV